MEENTRSAFIGGSDLGDILELPPYGCKLRCWLRKRGVQPDFQPFTSGPMLRGTRAEDAVVDQFSADTGMTCHRYSVPKARIRQFPSYYGGHPDRAIVTPEHEKNGPGILEAKCPGWYIFREVKKAGVSQSYNAQLQWYLLLSGRQWGYFAIMNLEAWECLSIRVERDDALIMLIEDRVEQFWKLVENGPKPELIYDSKAKPCGRCEYRFQCHGEILPSYTGEIIEDQSYAPLVDEFAEASRIVKDATEYLEQIKAEIKDRIGGSGVIDSGNGKIYYTPYKSTRINSKALKKEKPEIYEQYSYSQSITPLKVYPRTKTK